MSEGLGRRLSRRDDRVRSDRDLLGVSQGLGLVVPVRRDVVC